LKVNENLNRLKGWTNGGPLVKSVKGEGRATRAPALARLASPWRVHVNDYFPKAVRGTPLHRLVTATTLYGYIEQGPSTISVSNLGDNGAATTLYGYIEQGPSTISVSNLGD
jgi:hypothetical protein